ncbi:multicopper oxidase family protein [Pseudomonas benzenivorans]|uniref:Multicopper oxidase domain-containing protein n=1 Tax=Pseudomonas benzenivorans TaxID=556533 RepID=A0ABY5H8Z3_9PSED|nr:multicopper oxidase domain-containing protein [Pseudomonas benzenivorans]UTW07879.1 multicopper oxidase domain-containing protein [Pseudomonas benzenivorans]
MKSTSTRRDKAKGGTEPRSDVEAPSASCSPETPAEGASRRLFVQGAALSLAVPLLLNATSGSGKRRERRDDDEVKLGDEPEKSPPTIPWQIELPLAYTPLEPVALDPAPMVVANTAAGEAGRDAHQRWDELYERPREYPPVHYEMSVEENPSWVFNPAYPPQPIWGFAYGGNAAISPGPTIFGRYGQPTIVRIYNRLPEDHKGFGSPQISTHLHNAHTGSESDGFPGDFYSANKAGPNLSAPGHFKDHFYANIYAGYDEQQNGIGDPQQGLGTLFYHDHTLDFTSPNLVRGLMGFYLLFDDIDSGDERDPNPAALRLPSYPYDYPLAFADRLFDRNGILFYDQVDPDGTLGDKVIVNGYIEPVLRVAARKYRLRLLNGGPSRAYEFYLVDLQDRVQTFTYIANDGNLLPAPLFNQHRVRLSAAERGDIVVDFARYPIGTELYLVNRLKQEKTRRPEDVEAPGVRVLKLIVDRFPPRQDLSRVPAALRELAPLDPEVIANARVRRFEFERTNGMWAINDKFFNPLRSALDVPQEEFEVWDLVNNHGGWSHPIHMHLEEGRTIAKFQDGVEDDDEVPVPPHEQGRKDVFVLQPNSRIKVLVRFRDFRGKYVIHCHNLVHEDHAMMLRFDVVPFAPAIGPTALDPEEAPAPEDGGGSGRNSKGKRRRER